MRKSDEKKPDYVKIVIAVLGMLFLIGAVACIVCIAVFRNNVLFIPMAVCFVFALILFTYFRYGGK